MIAVHRKVFDVDRPTALSRISTGTSIGIAGAGIAALVMALTGVSWRVCWAFLRARERCRADRQTGWFCARSKGIPRAAPNVDGAISCGSRRCRSLSSPSSTARFPRSISPFAGDHMLESGGRGGLPRFAAHPPWFFLIYGLFGLTGLPHRAHRGGDRAALAAAWPHAGGRVVPRVRRRSCLAAGWGSCLCRVAGGLHVMMTSARACLLVGTPVFRRFRRSASRLALVASAAGECSGAFCRRYGGRRLRSRNDVPRCRHTSRRDGACSARKPASQPCR